MDEFKDFAHDKKYYPNRPVPRGLINLSEISLVLIIVLITQLFLNLYIGSALGIFAVIQIYTAFMGKEFFVKEWLSKHFALYILSHEVITPALFIYLFLLTTTPITFQSIVTSLTLSINLFLLEIGRKLKPREPSREANDTYLERFGLRGVALLIFTLTLVSAIFVKSISGSNVSWLPLATLPIMWIYLNKYFSQGWQKYSPTLFVIVISFVLVSNLVLFIS